MNINRQPAGQPTGGQFAEGARAGANVALSSGTKTRTEMYLESLTAEDRVLAKEIIAEFDASYGIPDEQDPIEYIEGLDDLNTDGSTGEHFGLDAAVNAAHRVTREECADVKVGAKYFNNDGDFPAGWEAWYQLEGSNPKSDPVVTREVDWEDSYQDYPEAEGFEALMVYARAAKETTRQMQATYDRNRRPSLQEMAYLVEVDKMRRDETRIEWADKDGNIHQGTVRGGSWTEDGQLDPGDGPGTHVRVTMSSGTERFIPFEDMAEKIAGHSLRGS